MSQFLSSVYKRIPTELWVVKNKQCGFKLPLKNFTEFDRRDMTNGMDN